jgi:hypothetical protein
MLRRAFLSLLPAFLALVFLCGTPATSRGGVEVNAASLSIKAATTPVARGSLTGDVDDVSVNQTADEDDTPDDRIVRAVTTIVWPHAAHRTRTLHASERAGDRHRPCAAPPRAPPTA